MNEELLRLVNSIHLEKGIDRELLFESLEAAIASAARKKYNHIEELRIKIDRQTADILLLDGDRRIDVLDPRQFGRIAAQTAKQVMIQRIREAESDVVYEEFQAKAGSVVSGVIQRIERGAVICNIGKTDAMLPRQEQVPSETYHPGDRLRCYVLSVKRKGSKVVILLSRTHPELVRELFKMEVPEIYDHIVEIKGVVREPGYRTKIAVASSDSRVDAVGACVGVRGSRIRNIVEELNGEKIDIVRWNENPEIFIRNALSPAELDSIEFDKHVRRARVIVRDDQLSLAIGKKGQNVRLSSKLTGWELDIMTTAQYTIWREKGRQEIASLPHTDEAMRNNLLLAGFECFRDIVERGAAEVMKAAACTEAQAQAIFTFAVDGYRKRVEEETKAAAEERTRKAAERAAAEAAPKPEPAEATSLETALRDEKSTAAETATPLEEALAAPAVAADADGGSAAVVDLESALKNRVEK